MTAVPLAVLFLVLVAGVAEAKDRRVLISLADLPVSRGEYVSGFEIHTWGVRFMAVCRVPVGWRITAGSDGTAQGSLSGEAGVGAAAFPAPNPIPLRGLVLAEVGNLQARTIRTPDGVAHPATFEGTVQVGRYGDDAEPRRAALAPASIRLVPATACPPPGP